MKKLRWKKNKNGRYAPKSHSLSRGDGWLAMVQECRGGWFWYGCGINTASQPAKSLFDAKKEALDYVKKHQAARK